jgi:hypothetical protein
MNLGRNTAASLAAEIDALGEADWLEDELLRIKGSMQDSNVVPAKVGDQEKNT